VRQLHLASDRAVLVAPALRPPVGVWFKWGWNVETGETVVWSVSGAGDGLPTHAGYLGGVWGREPNLAAGDLLGDAFRPISDPKEGEETASEEIFVHAYYDKDVPAAVVGWFRHEFPAAGV
jgi:hypothetical protein